MSTTKQARRTRQARITLLDGNFSKSIFSITMLSDDILLSIADHLRIVDIAMLSMTAKSFASTFARIFQRLNQPDNAVQKFRSYSFWTGSILHGCCAKTVSNFIPGTLQGLSNQMHVEPRVTSMTFTQTSSSTRISTSRRQLYNSLSVQNGKATQHMAFRSSLSISTTEHWMAGTFRPRLSLQGTMRYSSE